MKSNKLHIERLKQNFLKGEIISRSRLYDFYKKRNRIPPQLILTGEFTVY